MSESEPGFVEQITRFTFRHAGLLAIAALLLIGWWADSHILKSRVQFFLWTHVTNPSWLPGSNFKSLATVLLLPLITLFLAFANLYLKISTRAPQLQRLLTPGAFLNVPFAVYFSVYLLLAIFAYTILGDKLTNPLAKILVPALVGIGAANADLKFGGFSVQPFADFLQSIEAVVEAGISARMNELSIAKRASLRDQLIESVDTDRLERECNLLGVPAGGAAVLKTKAGADEKTYKGLLATEIIKESEADAWRLVAATASTSSRYRIRWWAS